MQQPALRLALLTFATMLVSGCAEQFAAHMAQSMSMWTMVPVKAAGGGKTESRTVTPSGRSSGERLVEAASRKHASVRFSWGQPGATTLDLASTDLGLQPPALRATVAASGPEFSPWGEGRRMETSDYRRVRVA